MRVAIVHDWLDAPGGAEKVLAQIVECFPDAALFSVVDFLADRAWLGDRPVATSFVQSLPFARRRYRAYLPLMPLAVRQFDLSGYDLIVSSSRAVAKGVRVRPGQTHVSYVHAPLRCVWDQQRFLHAANLSRGPASWLARLVLHALRGWDVQATHGVDRLIARSHFGARRLMKAYGREAAVIAPPVDVHRFEWRARKDDFYLVVAPLQTHQRIDLIVDAFNAMPRHRLVVIGAGPQLNALRAKAARNVSVLGGQPDEVVKDYLQRARALVHAAPEAGVVVLEAQACGTPVIALGEGDVLETVVPVGEAHATGVYFGSQSIGALQAAVARFERLREHITARACRANAERYASAVFRRAFVAEVARALAAAGERQPVHMRERADETAQAEASPDSANRHPEAARGTAEF